MRNGTSACVLNIVLVLSQVLFVRALYYVYNDTNISFNHHSVHAGLFLLSFLNKRVEEEKREVSYLTVSIHGGVVYLFCISSACMLSFAECAGG